jgi:hypothetical protein
LFYAAVPLKIGDSFRQPGEAVPEANGWRNVQSYLNIGHLVWIPDSVPRQEADRMIADDAAKAQAVQNARVADSRAAWEERAQRTEEAAVERATGRGRGRRVQE